MSDQKLFNEFPPVATEQWEEKIKQDLRGADYEKKLVTKTPDGLRIKPYYREEDLKICEYLQSSPGKFPFVRSSKTKDNNFDIRQNIFVEDFETANKKAVNAVERGANSIGFYVCHQEHISQKDFDILIKNINPETIMLNFISGKLSEKILKLFLKNSEQKKQNPNKIKASFDFDPFGYTTITGDFYNKKNPEKDFGTLKNMLKLTEKYSFIKILTVNGIYFANAGVYPVQELAFALSSANETLAEAQKAGINIENLIPKIIFTFGIGSNYFIEIAKLRAARFLWAKIVETWTAKREIGEMFINSINSDLNKTVCDPYVNQLRNTTEAMSAVIGGTDWLTVNPFDKAYKKPNKFSERIARNIGIILKEEAYFDKSIDPSAGSYYIENLTDNIADKSWELFLEIENKGGYYSALKQNLIQTKIKEAAQTRDLNIATRKEILLGTNQYPNLNETIKDDIDFNVYSWSLPENKNSEIEPIKFYRGAKAFEELRLSVEKLEKQPGVFLLTYGNLAMRKARATFATNFFACAGYKIIDNPGFENLKAGTDAALKEKADIVVICSSDDEYLEIVSEISNSVKGKAITVIAGYPKNHINELNEKGIEHFIHVKSDVLKILQNFNKLLGIK
ncbi:MAG: methylmalonyl-CoA mutase small subunit [Chlorobi bacterium]|nr:methylmalonyl-CoA mutase small subunit [Chlorobiota bacterium]